MLVVLAKEEACRAARSHPVAKPSLSQQAESAPAWHWISTGEQDINKLTDHSLLI